GWPSATADFLRKVGLDAAVLLEFRAGHLQITSTCQVKGHGWAAGPRADDAIEKAFAASLAVGEFQVPVAGDEIWAPFLARGGYRRCVTLKLDPQTRSSLLLCARQSARPFPVRAQAGARKLGLAVALGRKGTGPATEETAFLLSVSRDLSRAVDFQNLEVVVRQAVDKVLDWEALCLTPGAAERDAACIRGGGGMGAAARRQFEDQMVQEARIHGLPLTRFTWKRTPPSGESGLFPASLVFPLPWGRGCTGILAVQPAAGASVGEDRYRLLSAVAAEVSMAIRRLRTAAGKEDGRLGVILQSLPSGVILIDHCGRLRRFNPAAERMLSSLSRRKVEPGQRLVHLGLPGMEACLSGPVELCGLADQKIYSVLGAPVAGEGEAGGGVLVISDITVEQARREQAQQAERMSSLGTMLSGVAHELNNPLASVIGFSQLLLKQADGEKARRRLDLIVAEAQRCRRIVRGLLNVARVPVPERTMISINDLVDGVVSLFQYPLRADNIQLTWTPGVDLPLVQGDRGQLQQVLVNLLTNAQQSLKRKNGGRCLELTTWVSRNRVRIEVSDNGPGIPASHLQRIFSPFFTTKAPGTGTGLGLAIVKTVVEEHGGTLNVRSSSGRGAVFTIDLPAAPHPHGVTEKRATPWVNLPLSGCRALVVDDEATFRQMLKESLEAEGVRVRTAAGGGEALKTLQQHGFDVIISDLRMPGLNGIQLVEEAVRLKPGIQKKFILTTGALPDSQARQFIQKKGLICLRKPFGLDELFHAMSKVHRPLPAHGETVVELRSRD
ncbi:MAG: ATP-binding protein, partial [Acidobacteriota bacterium]